MVVLVIKLLKIMKKVLLALMLASFSGWPGNEASNTVSYVPLPAAHISLSVGANQTIHCDSST